MSAEGMYLKTRKSVYADCKAFVAKHTKRAGDDECWEWTYVFDVGGPGVIGTPAFSIDGDAIFFYSGKSKGKNKSAARRRVNVSDVLASLAGASITHGGLMRCRNNGCVNPSHVQVVSLDALSVLRNGQATSFNSTGWEDLDE